MTQTKPKPCHFLYDKEDEALVLRYKWYIKPKGYVARDEFKEGKRTHIYFHREIMNPPKEMEIDHINRNPLDNRKNNLRIVTHSQNLVNNGQQAGISKYRGVWRAHSQKEAWCACIKRNGKRKHIGTFKTPEEASKAWNEASKLGTGFSDVGRYYAGLESYIAKNKPKSISSQEVD